MELDRKLIADAVEHELFRHPDFRGNWSALERESRVSHSTMSRLKRADERVTQGKMRQIEAALGLPFDTLATVGAGDLDGLRELGVPDKLIAWLTPRIAAHG
jgi:hypothetical protein